MNSDNNLRALINTNELDWKASENKNVFMKILSSTDITQTALIKLDEEASFDQTATTNSVEIFVLEGTYINEFGTFTQGHYLRFPKEDESFIKTTNGCVIFRKINYFDDEQTVIIDTQSSQFLPGQGNLEVLPLHEQTALVKWPKNEKFIPHKHWGGEEVLVLKGIFMDEHGKYPKWCWISSPHLSNHFPYVEEETIILVKTGHM